MHCHSVNRGGAVASCYPYSNSSKQTAADALLEISPRRRHEQQIELELTNTTLHQALQNVAQYLRSNKAQITIVAVGGATNTLLLKTRTTTHDLEFFNQDLRKDEWVTQVKSRVRRMS
jgi:hypothetical protein